MRSTGSSQACQGTYLSHASQPIANAHPGEPRNMPCGNRCHRCHRGMMAWMVHQPSFLSLSRVKLQYQSTYMAWREVRTLLSTPIIRPDPPSPGPSLPLNQVPVSGICACRSGWLAGWLSWFVVRGLWFAARGSWFVAPFLRQS